MSFRALIVLVMTAALASGCGFHLRGKIPLAEQLQIIAVSIPDREVKDEMISALEASGAEVVSDPASARALLDMFQVNYERRVRTIDTRGKVTGYVLRYDVQYRVVNAEGEELRKTRLALQRDYNFDPEQILQAEEEEESLKEDMIKELAQRIMRQLVTIAALDIDPRPVRPGTGPEERAAA
jgi:LPS-assembly lipoprotein